MSSVEEVRFSSGTVKYVYDGSLADVAALAGGDCMYIVDSNVLKFNPEIEKIRHIVLETSEESKQSETVTDIVEQLLQMGATRKTCLIGIGGGCLTDIVGYVSAIYMRGIRVGFMPTTVLGLVDAAIGGKNGVNVGMVKNIIGTIRQPEFLLFDMHLLRSLPANEWSNGFAEIIKYACIFDAALFHELELHDVDYYRTNEQAFTALVRRCVAHKNRIVQADEHEKAERKLLNFGHTFGHAIENLYNLAHGQAVAIGMLMATRLSEEYSGLSSSFGPRLQQVLERYDLPVSLAYKADEVMNLLTKDKKRMDASIDYILLQDLGKAYIMPLQINQIETILSRYES